MANIEPDPAPSYDDAERADQPPSKAYRLCRQCRGWGVVSRALGGGLFRTEDCPDCGGSGEELNL